MKLQKISVKEEVLEAACKEGQPPLDASQLKRDSCEPVFSYQRQNKHRRGLGAWLSGKMFAYPARGPGLDPQLLGREV